MDSLPLSKATNSNLLQILKKCDDVSFVRAIQTCRRLHDIADRTKPRVFTLAYLAAFVYYDETEKKIMFDVPYVHERKNGMVLRPRKRNNECHHRKKSEREVEDDRYWYGMRTINPGTCYNWMCWIFDPPRSQLLFHRSARSQAFHKKMTAEELGQLLQFFRFETLAINVEKRHPNAKYIQWDEEVLKVLPSIRASVLSMRAANSHDLFGRIFHTAQDICGIKQLRALPVISRAYYGELIEDFEFDWHTLEALEGKCQYDNIEPLYKDLITKWKSGRTKIQYLELNAHAAPGDYQATFQEGPVFLQAEAYIGEDSFHYVIQ